MMGAGTEGTDLVPKLTVNETKASRMTFSQGKLDSQIDILDQSACVVHALLWLAPVLSSAQFSICSGLVRSSHADGSRNVPFASPLSFR